MLPLAILKDAEDESVFSQSSEAVHQQQQKQQQQLQQQQLQRKGNAKHRQGKLTFKHSA